MVSKMIVYIIALTIIVIVLILNLVIGYFHLKRQRRFFERVEEALNSLFIIIKESADNGKKITQFSQKLEKFENSIKDEIKREVLAEEEKRNSKIIDEIGKLKGEISEIKKELSLLKNKNIDVKNQLLESKSGNPAKYNSESRRVIKREIKDDYLKKWISTNEYLVYPHEGKKLSNEIRAYFNITDNPDNNVRKVIKPAHLKEDENGKIELIEGGKIEYVY
jgi:seryl-tRNA synthetase